MNLDWVSSSDAVAEAAARVDAALRGAGEGARLGIPGGSAAAAVGVLRARCSLWASLRVTWVDERRVPFEHADSNRGAAHRAGFLAEEAPPALELPLYEKGALSAARASAEAAFRKHFGGALDVSLLGMGPDGHIASLFPVMATGAPKSEGRRGELAREDGDLAGEDGEDGDLAGEDKALVAAIADSPKPPAERLTLTRRALGTATASVLLAMGEAKRDALRRLRAGDPRLPATGLPGLVVVTDQKDL